MNTISISYPLKWQFKNYPYIKVSNCKKVFNTKTGKMLKITVNGGSIGLWIGKKFILKYKLNDCLELIPTKEYSPF